MRWVSNYSRFRLYPAAVSALAPGTFGRYHLGQCLHQSSTASLWISLLPSSFPEPWLLPMHIVVHIRLNRLRCGFRFKRAVFLLFADDNSACPVDEPVLAAGCASAPLPFRFQAAMRTRVLPCYAICLLPQTLSARYSHVMMWVKKQRTCCCDRLDTRSR